MTNATLRGKPDAGKLLMALLVGVVCVASGWAGEWINLYDDVQNAGLSLTSSSGDSVYVGSVSKLFNGVIYAASDTGSQRVIFKKPADANPYVLVALPEVYRAGARPILRRVDFFPVTYWGNADNRMPTEYKVYGVDETDGLHELIHPTNQSYPGLGTNATNGQFYAMNVPSSAASEVGYRKYKIEFLGTTGSTWEGNNTVLSFMEIRLWVEFDDRQVTSLSQLMRDAGYEIKYTTSEQWTRAQNYWSIGAYAFDGRNYLDDGVSTSARWMGYMAKTDGVYAEIRVPDALCPGDEFVLTHYILWGLSNSAPNDRTRAPTEWKIFGTDQIETYWKDPTDGNWCEVVHMNGVDWTSVPDAKGKNTLGVMDAKTSGGTYAGYRAFRFRPLRTSLYNPPDVPSTTSTIDVGLWEVELRGMMVNRKGSLRVRSTVPGCDFGAGNPADGALVETTCEVAASEYVTDGTKGYRVKGYHLETYDYTVGSWTVGALVASRTYSYVRDAAVSECLVWELEEAAGPCLFVRRNDNGPETVTCDPAGPCYESGAVVTVTAHPCSGNLEAAGSATNLCRSAFLRWEGDTDGIADVTSPVITVTMDRHRVLTPVFRRDWLVYEYDKANEGGSGTEWRMKDGNFDLRINAETFSSCKLSYSNNTWLVSGRGPLDLSTTVVRAGDHVDITEIYLPQLGSKDTPRADFSRVVLPTTLERIVCSAFRDQTNIVEVVIDCPELTTMGDCVFTRGNSIDRVVLKAPKMTKFAGDYTFFNAPMDETDASEWDLRSLVTFSTTDGSQRHFSLGERGSGHGFYGTLTLPAVTNIGTAEFLYQGHVTNIVLGCAKGSLREIKSTAFSHAQSLRHLSVGCGEDLAVAADAFSNSAALETLTLLKFVPSQAAVDAMLVNNADDARAELYVSRYRPLWDGFMQEIDPNLDPNPPAGAVGVYKTAGDVRKAWIIYKESPLDPKGLLILVR